ncbi:site-specific DNA-methyltransferase [Pontibacter ramchanderi]|uniref:site-specific DNA-methyltransferase (adenine-specific) n=1 Tax=Pontibacter ramchanderi TaxID=1179743 RepID=A0A2N3V2R0_9BACT|nr:site-specific DNA-methyltransferase [Pontibacter ramchanderi]PKV75888.1 adenine-specific DNA-methyltransferase [Pontibacter ramchanderi]
MDTITKEHELAQSQNIVTDNIEKLKQLFPTVFTEGKVDFDVLRSVLGDYVENENERYQFTWKGKAQALREAHKTSTGTLRPCPEESVNWDSTQNLYIEGDNLEVLKLLQKSYHGCVKMIYIDPPYNTGKDFVYKDNYKDNLKNYLEITEQGKGFGTNSESSGRYHSNWLNMMYPRLKLARNLLSDEGAIFISIDGNEIENLKKLCNEIFGEDNYIEQIIWKKRSTPPNDKIIGAAHEYILIFAKNVALLKLNLRQRSVEQIGRYKNPDNHSKGPWTSGDLMANVKGGRYVASLYYPIVNPKTGEEHYPSSNGNWRFNKEKIDQLLEKDEIYFGEDGKGRPKLKRFLCDVKDGITYTTLWDFVPLNTEGSSEMARILGNMSIFDNPKPSGLVKELLKLGSTKDGLILDFFSGSATTAHAVFDLNISESNNLKFILVQLPEVTDKGSEAFKAGFKTIAEIGKERIRRVIKEITLKEPTKSEQIDLGFKVYKLDSSNIKEWDPSSNDIQKTLYDSINNIKAGRTEADIVSEILLKYGLDLTLPIKEYHIAGNNVYSIGHGALLVCLSENITMDTIGGIGELKEDLAPEVCRVVLRDNGFKDDVAKTNAMQVLKRYGIEDVKSI